METRRALLAARLAPFGVEDVVILGRGRAVLRQRIAGLEAMIEREGQMKYDPLQVNETQVL